VIYCTVFYHFNNKKKNVKKGLKMWKKVYHSKICVYHSNIFFIFLKFQVTVLGFIFEAPSDHDPNGKNQIYNMSKKT
jgi:hypothetical protein